VIFAVFCKVSANFYSFDFVSGCFATYFICPLFICFSNFSSISSDSSSSSDSDSSSLGGGATTFAGAACFFGSSFLTTGLAYWAFGAACF